MKNLTAPEEEKTVTEKMESGDVSDFAPHQDSNLDESGIKSENDAFVKGSVTMTMTQQQKKMAGALLVVAVIAGTLTGFGVYKLQNKSGNTLPASEQPMSQVAGDSVNNGDIFGSPDAETFKDSAQGFLELGGIDGEGSHKLLRPGGASQIVYLTSSITDLDKFEGMEIKIWGETFKAQQAGWLMDVGRVEVIETEGESPSED